MFDLQNDNGPRGAWKTRIWHAPIWPTLAVMAVLGCAALGVAHRHGATLAANARAQTPVEVVKIPDPADGAVTPATYRHAQAMPRTEAQ